MKRGIGVRDYDYIETRLTSGDIPSLEARGRLKQIGDTELSDRLMKAAQEYNDTLRSVLFDFRAQYNRGGSH